jgi:hypothetical protein
LQASTGNPRARKSRRQTHDLGIVRKKPARREHAAQEQRRINRRNLAAPTPLAGFGVNEMVKPTALVRRLVGVKVERDAHARARVLT